MLSGCPIPPSSLTVPACPGLGTDFFLGPGVLRTARTHSYLRHAGDPSVRLLRIFSLDPAVSRLEGSITTVSVPYEPLAPGPVGALLAVDNYDTAQGVHYRRADLDSPAVLICDGYAPSPTDPRFHQQMVYAVCMRIAGAFRQALGREITWGFQREDDDGVSPLRLTIRPHAVDAQNAWYDKVAGELCFGYYLATIDTAGRNLPGSYVFTCLSHDIVVHEMTHALLDGLRAQLSFPSGPDTIAFHEGFADLIALFQHFSYDQPLFNAIQKSRGDLLSATLLTDLAKQFGQTTAGQSALRSAVDSQEIYDSDMEAHRLGSVLASAIFSAFNTIFQRKTARYFKLATGGTGVLAPGDISPYLQSALAKEAAQLAQQFTNICIRAIDYCPPVDLEYGEFLRALVTADADLVPDDPWGYREAFIDAFCERKIYPRHVANLAEDALLWRAPARPIPPLKDLSFAELKFSGDPGQPADAAELKRQACALGWLVTRPEYRAEFGLARAGEPRLGADAVDPPQVESVRCSRRVGPDGQVVFDLVAEVTQRRIVRARGPEGEFDFYGGATVIVGPDGTVRYVIRKNILDEARLERQRVYMNSQSGRRYWQLRDGQRKPVLQLFKLLHHTENY